MKPSEKIKGIAFACKTTGGYDMVRQSGVEWMRLNICFPWTDKISGTLSAQFVIEREEFRRGQTVQISLDPNNPNNSTMLALAKRETNILKIFKMLGFILIVIGLALMGMTIMD